MKTTVKASKNSPAHKTPSPVTQPADVAAFEAMKPEYDAMDDTLFMQINTDPIAAVTTVQGCYDPLIELRPVIQKHAPQFDIALLDRTLTMALALQYADGAAAAASKPGDELPKNAEEAIALRTLLQTAAVPLVQLGIVEGVRAGELSGGHGYRDLIHDLVTLSAMYRPHWPSIVGKVPFDMVTVDHANELATRIGHGIGVRDRTAPEVVEAARYRQAAYTTLFRAWAKVQNVIAFVRFEHGDADQYAPTLFVRTPGNGSKKAEASKPVTPGAPVIATPATPATPVAMGSVDAKGNPPSHMPGGSPFTG